MSEMKIARFVNLAACKSIFSEHSTFVLRSPEYYRRCDGTEIGDKNELRSKHRGGGGSQVGDCFVLSCWTMLDGDEPTSEDWKIFPDSRVAIISTPRKVSAFLEKAFGIENENRTGNGRRFPFSFVMHKKVMYADEIDKPDIEDMMDKVVFNKDSKFEYQKEYRFALGYGTKSHAIESYIFSGDPDGYLDKCFVNPKGKNKEELRLILLEAGAGYGHFSDKKPCDIIANFEVLF